MRGRRPRLSFSTSGGGRVSRPVPPPTKRVAVTASAAHSASARSSADSSCLTAEERDDPSLSSGPLPALAGVDRGLKGVANTDPSPANAKECECVKGMMVGKNSHCRHT